MKGFRAVVTQSSRDKVLSGLHETGVAQFREVSMEEIEAEEMEEEFFEINSVLGRMEEAQEFFETLEMDTEMELEDESIDYILEYSREILEEIEPKMDELSSRLQEIQGEREELKDKVDILSKLVGIDLPLEYLQSTERIEIDVGQISEDELDDFTDEIKDSLSDKVFLAAFGEGNTRIVVLICRKEYFSDLRPIKYKFGVESLDLPVSDKTPEEFLEDLDEEIEKYENEEDRVREEIEKIREEKADKINALAEVLKIEQERQESLQLFGRTDSTTIIEGWAPKEEVEEVEEAIEEATEGAYLMKVYDPSETDISETPVRLENPRGVDSYEYLTEMYSLPRYDSTDPTLIVAITFSIFFGFTLSDAGYGLLILALFLSGMTFIKNMFSKRLRYIMIAGAIGTILAGALFGSWFGGAFGEILPNILGPQSALGKGLSTVFGPLWTDPIRNPIPFLKLTVYFGILHLGIGFAVAGVRKNILRSKWRRVFLNNIGNTLLLLGLFSLAFCVVGMGQEFGLFFFPEMELFEAFNPLGSKSTLVVIYQGLFYGGVVLSTLGRVTAEGASMRDRIGGAVNTIYSVIDFVSNVVSYTRILALGVATSVIALVINEIARIFFTMIYPGTFSGVLSYVLAAVSVVGVVVVLVVGHFFNMFINSITGFVHTMRLHYAEFFQTFYESGGEEYSPFKLIRKYTKSWSG